MKAVSKRRRPQLVLDLPRQVAIAARPILDPKSAQD